jgi:hypothetical protein
MNGTTEALLYEKIPARIFTAEETAGLLNRSGRLRVDKSGTHPWTVESLIGNLNEDADIALGLFQAQMKGFKSPQILTGFSSIEQIKQEFGQPPHTHFRRG